MVEGIFDLGKAGFRKGLRLTGLQDNIENAKASLNVGSIQSKSNPKKKSLKATKAESTEKSVVAEECLDTIWMNPLTMDSPNFDGQILLVSVFSFIYHPELLFMSSFMFRFEVKECLNVLIL